MAEKSCGFAVPKVRQSPPGRLPSLDVHDEEPGHTLMAFWQSVCCVFWKGMIALGLPGCHKTLPSALKHSIQSRVVLPFLGTMHHRQLLYGLAFLSPPCITRLCWCLPGLLGSCSQADSPLESALPFRARMPGLCREQNGQGCFCGYREHLNWGLPSLHHYIPPFEWENSGAKHNS